MTSGTWFALCRRCGDRELEKVPGTKQRLSGGSGARCDICGDEAAVAFYPEDERAAATLESKVEAARGDRDAGD